MPELILKNIERLGRAYCARHLGCWDRGKLESDWFEALKFFFTHSFMRGRRDELSNEYCWFTIDRVQNDILRVEDHHDAYRRLQDRANEFEKDPLLSFKKKYRLGKRTASKHERFAEEVAETHSVIRLLTTPKNVKVPWDDQPPYTKSVWLGNDDDVLMVLDTLKFISEEHRRNIYVYLRDVMRNDGASTARAELIKLWAVKEKISTFVIRDIELLNPGLLHDNFEAAFPVDTWVRRLAAKIGCTEKTDEAVRQYFILECRDQSLNAALVAAGLWYLGFHSLDILIDDFLGEYPIIEDARRLTRTESN